MSTSSGERLTIEVKARRTSRHGKLDLYVGE